MMAKVIPVAERVHKAEELIQQARQFPVGTNSAFLDLDYVAGVKDLLRRARDLVKFIPFSPSADAETKAASKSILKKIAETDTELLHHHS
jgi:hypothetical protein